ncbi:hypothetical protein BATDEDRAFT_23629 [Batrachochytrium dendrobatidis JAM81]|uniref:Uncharacterized protein n=2 Tax=Batrachochytrium dendrobatidis TaxID=109871 RepID=F4NXW2_BATDJ|nr:uncharacterized protein BATDEDRAFT_23629 [Batrachochytrium dendrobatidis JAM81]EGF81917.1 hypothetical protein BATDEDRAFT_23629 [Batrachochytrium dendrobatidis JAM81]OAJ40607.1 hypothetical protein BDEG_24318 [Batrachochytrium dendrobatidis JEL423]|eukprot:XP_006677332.1 hypothetical protein BATDEDRAFT_23629 [Batrachochytrium dendrobatidis JAM81]
MLGSLSDQFLNSTTQNTNHDITALPHSQVDPTITTMNDNSRTPIRLSANELASSLVDTTALIPTCSVQASPSLSAFGSASCNHLDHKSPQSGRRIRRTISPTRMKQLLKINGKLKDHSMGSHGIGTLHSIQSFEDISNSSEEHLYGSGHDDGSKDYAMSSQSNLSISHSAPVSTHFTTQGVSFEDPRTADSNLSDLDRTLIDPPANSLDPASSSLCPEAFVELDKVHVPYSTVASNLAHAKTMSFGMTEKSVRNTVSLRELNFDRHCANDISLANPDKHSVQNNQLTCFDAADHPAVTSEVFRTLHRPLSASFIIDTLASFEATSKQLETVIAQRKLLVEQEKKLIRMAEVQLSFLQQQQLELSNIHRRTSGWTGSDTDLHSDSDESEADHIPLFQSLPEFPHVNTFDLEDGDDRFSTITRHQPNLFKTTTETKTMEYNLTNAASINDSFRATSPYVVNRSPTPPSLDVRILSNESEHVPCSDLPTHMHFCNLDATAKHMKRPSFLSLFKNGTKTLKSRLTKT